MKKTKRLVLLAMLTAVAMILSYVESLLPSVGIPGVKMGHIIAVEMGGRLPLGRARDRVARSGRQQLRFAI